MRMRTRNNLEGRLADCAALFADLKTPLPEGPLHIEVGCGKGRFINECARLFPEVNFLAVERVSNVIVLAMEKARDAGLNNLKFVRDDFAAVAPMLPDSCAERIYLNFSDPWPKKGNAKRRLTYGSFLEQYKRILNNGGEIYFKTDNRPLFDFSLETFAENGFELRDVTLDLHAGRPEGNIMTEYEQRFVEMGTPICRLVAAVEK